MAPVFGRIACPDLNRLFQSDTIDGITSLLDFKLLLACQKTIAPEVQALDSGGQELVIRDGVSGGYVTQTEYLITKYASESKLNKRNGISLLPWQPERISIPAKFVLTESGK